jgi:DNA-binding LacI/PurR family transcriptional regulator
VANYSEQSFLGNETSEAPTSKAKYPVVAEYLRQQMRCGAMKSGDRMPSMSEIQSKFGVSLGTVQRVHDLLEQEGLIVREQGRGTFVAEQRKPKTGLIGFVGSIFSTTSQFPVSLQLAEGVSEVLDRHHLRLLMVDAHSPLGWDKVDGLLVCSPGQIENISGLLPSNLPVVSMLAPLPNKSSVLADDFNGARLGIQQLLERGHRKIACLMEKQPVISQERVRGYLAALQDAGIAPEPTWIRQNQRLGMEDYRIWGRRNLEEWLNSDWKATNCTALLVQNDFAAIGAMLALQEAGLSIPNDVSVVSFDGTEICEYINPHLSAVEIPLRQIGVEACELLVRQISQPNSISPTITLPMSFCDRKSIRHI